MVFLIKSERSYTELPSRLTATVIKAFMFMLYCITEGVSAVSGRSLLA
jgi:hypothetical protein